jgi:hypothetical protein
MLAVRVLETGRETSCDLTTTTTTTVETAELELSKIVESNYWVVTTILVYVVLKCILLNNEKRGQQYASNIYGPQFTTEYMIRLSFLRGKQIFVMVFLLSSGHRLGSC